MSAIPLTIFVVAPISGHLADHLGTRYLCAFGAAVAGVALLAMAGLVGTGLSESSSHVSVVLGLLAIGFSSGLFQSPNNVALMSAIQTEKLGVASAIMATIRNLGLVTGTGIAAKVFSWRHSETGNFVDAFHYALYIAGFLAFGAAMASLAKRDEVAVADHP